MPNISPPQLVRRCILGSILESEKNYLDALKRILEVRRHRCNRMPVPLLWGFVITVHLICLISNTRSPCPRLSPGCWATGNWRWPSIACVRSCSATSCSRSPWRAEWLSGTAWRWSGMSLWHRWDGVVILKKNCTNILLMNITHHSAVFKSVWHSSNDDFTQHSHS